MDAFPDTGIDIKVHRLDHMKIENLLRPRKSNSQDKLKVIGRFEDHRLLPKNTQKPSGDGLLGTRKYVQKAGIAAL